jgi:hypothetical protein
VHAVVTASSLNVRPDPSTNQPPLGQLPRGTVVLIDTTHGGWYHVTAGALVGFVRGDYVVVIDPSPAAGFLRARADLALVPLEPAQLIDHTGLQGRAARAATTWDRSGGLVGIVAQVLEMLPSAAIAVLCVESGGRGFADDGKMTIRFENHIFFDQWGSANRADFDRHFRFNASRRWTGHTHSAAGNGPFVSFHGNQAGEWAAYQTAAHRNEPAALRSISMGSPQIMGFNHGLIGYDSARGMFDAFQAGERSQILGMFDFIKGPGSTSTKLQALQREQWHQFASLYNGPGNAAEYGSRIREYEEVCRPLLP